MKGQKTGLDRRQFTRLSTAAAAAALLPSGACLPSRRQPNVLFIAVDDMNDWPGCLGGHPHAKTPHLDALAQRGMLFTNAHCPAPQCSGSRTAVLTGVEPYNSGVYDNVHDYRQAYPDLVNLPQKFMAEGYQVTNVGKMFHFPEPTSFQFAHHPGGVNLRQFRDLDDGWGRGDPPDDRGFDWGPVSVGMDSMNEGKVAAKVEQELAERSEPPFYLSVGIFRPHLPWFIPKPILDRFPINEISVPMTLGRDRSDLGFRAKKFITENRHRAVLRAEQRKKVIACYLAAMALADDTLARVMAALDASPYADETIVVLWSDHGHHLGEKIHWSKYTLWEDTTHVPLIISAPGVTRPGRQSNAPVSLVHLYPTLVDLCGLTPQDGLDGTSLRPLMEDPQATWDRPAIITSGLSQAVRTERHRFIRYDTDERELYDHQTDPHEWLNLQWVRGSYYNEIKAELEAMLPESMAKQVPPMGSAEARRKARTVVGPSEIDEVE
jgi:arylsulfatase A-like enzyme